MNLADSYQNLVVTCSITGPSNTLPQVIRVREAGAQAFEVRLQNPSGASLTTETVQCLATEAGVWRLPDGRTMEARRVTSDQVAEDNSWVGAPLALAHSFSQPVVLGQVMSYNDADWSTFWSYGVNRSSAASQSSMNIGYTVAEDPDVTRAPETLGVIVIEAGFSGTLEAGTSADAVLGWDNSTSGTAVTVNGSYDSGAFVVLTQTGMDGGNGGWAIGRSLNGSTLRISIDEDQLRDSERVHISEQVNYVLLPSEGNLSLEAQ